MAVTYHHGTGKVLMEVIDVFTHPNTEWKNTTNTDCDAL